MASGIALARARARELLYLQNPRLWAWYPFLPVVRQQPDGARQCGVLYDARGMSGKYGFACTVFLVNLFALPPTEAELLAKPRCVYDTFEGAIRSLEMAR
jgi:hypothetical protein